MPFWLARLLLFLYNRPLIFVTLVLLAVGCCYLRVYELWWTPEGR